MHRLFPSTTYCFYAPPVSLHHLFPSITFLHAHFVYKHHLFPGTSNIQAPPVSTHHLFTRTTCFHAPEVYKHHLFSNNIGFLVPPISKHHMLASTPCFQLRPISKHHIFLHSPPVIKNHVYVSPLDVLCKQVGEGWLCELTFHEDIRFRNTSRPGCFLHQTHLTLIAQYSLVPGTDSSVI